MGDCSCERSHSWLALAVFRPGDMLVMEHLEPGPECPKILEGLLKEQLIRHELPVQIRRASKSQQIRGFFLRSNGEHRKSAFWYGHAILDDNGSVDLDLLRKE